MKSFLLYLETIEFARAEEETRVFRNCINPSVSQLSRRFILRVLKCVPIAEPQVLGIESELYYYGYCVKGTLLTTYKLHVRPHFTFSNKQKQCPLIQLYGRMHISIHLLTSSIHVTFVTMRSWILSDFSVACVLQTVFFN